MKSSDEYILGYSFDLDKFAHNWNAELVEKYSIFLVFATFVFGLALQLGYLVLALGTGIGWILVFDGLAAGLSLLAITLLLSTAMLGGYKMTPLPSECSRFVEGQRKFLQDSGRAGGEQETLDALKMQLLSVLSITVKDNVCKNEKKTKMLLAASISLLVGAICFGISVALFAVRCLSG